MWALGRRAGVLSRFTAVRASRFSTKPQAGVDVIGMPFTGGQPKGGVELAPAILRPLVVKKLEELGWDVKDKGNLDIPKAPKGVDTFSRVKNPMWCGSSSKILSDSVYETAKNNRFPLVIGGDHSIAVGTISGISKVHRDLGVIWVDAHADINTAGSTPSGNFHGMPLSFLLGLTDPVPGFEWLDMKNPCLASMDQLVYVGLRDLEQAEKDFLRTHNIKCFDMNDIDRMGIVQVVDFALKILGSRPIHISFDIDSLDPREAPSTGTPVRGGLSYREGAYLCEAAQDTGRLVSMEIVEINPSLGSEGDVDLTVKSGLDMIGSALGEKLTL